MLSIDLNADLGESFGRWTLGDDAAMVPLISSANVACGFHAGDPLTLRTVCAAAVNAGVSIGAQVAYPDLVGFGRRFIDMEPAELTAAVIYQIGALEAIARSVGGAVSFVKPHGALYNTIVHDTRQADAVLAAVQALRGEHHLRVVGLAGSQFLEQAAAAGLPTTPEAFADRGYRADGTLVPRQEAGAVITDPQQVADRVVRLVTAHTVTAVSGDDITVVARSVCLHGDTAGAVAIATAVRDALQANGIAVAAEV